MTDLPPIQPRFAALSMLAAMSVIGVIDNFIARLAVEIGLWQFLASRATLALPLVAGLSLIGLGTIWPKSWWKVAGRSFFVALAMLFYFSALAFMPIAQALAGLFTSPIFVLLFTAAGGAGRIGPVRVLAVGLGFVGTLMVLQPDPARLTLLSVMPVAGGLFYALGAITTRAWCGGESPVALLAGVMGMLGLIGLAGLGVLALFPQEAALGADGFVRRGFVWPMPVALPWVLVQAVGSLLGVFLIIRAYQLGEPSYVSVFEYSVMLFGPAFAWVAMGQALGPWQLAGILLIAGSGALIAVRSERAAAPA